MRCEQIDQWLDLLMDDALTAEQRHELNEHAHTCPQCAEQLRATLRLRAMMDSLPEEADVPLAAQAAWRNAVREEYKRGHSRRITRIAGGAAAAVVIALGIGWALNANVTPESTRAMTAKVAGAFRRDIGV